MAKHIDRSQYTTWWQVEMMLLIAMNHRFRDGGHPKQEVVAYIAENGWFEIQPDDKAPYKSGGTSEPRWHTLIAWARKNCIESNFFEVDGIRDSWKISKDGINFANVLLKQFRSRDVDVTKCYLFSAEFKKFLDPLWTPGPHNAQRPSVGIYEDTLPSYRRSVRGTKLERKIEEAAPKILADLLNPQSGSSS